MTGFAIIFVLTYFTMLFLGLIFDVYAKYRKFVKRQEFGSHWPNLFGDVIKQGDLGMNMNSDPVGIVAQAIKIGDLAQWDSSGKIKVYNSEKEKTKAA